jgi:hypothetical protein
MWQTGHTFERTNIEAHLARSSRCPMSGVMVEDKTLMPNHALRNAIQDYVNEHPAAAEAAGAKSAHTASQATSIAPPQRPPPCPLPSSVSMATSHVQMAERGGANNMQNAPVHYAGTTAYTLPNNLQNAPVLQYAGTTAYTTSGPAQRSADDVIQAASAAADAAVSAAGRIRASVAAQKAKGWIGTALASSAAVMNNAAEKLEAYANNQ